MTTALITHSIFSRHEMIPGHPESPQRLSAIEDQLIRLGIADFLVHAEAPRASRQQLERVHSPGLIDLLNAMSPEEGLAHIDPDTSMNKFTLEAAWHAAGATVHAVEIIMAGQVRNAFCCVRPPGHHAERNQAMGFCFFNNIAVAAAAALEEHGLERVAILDFDVHHGNGTENIFIDDSRVMVCSTYQHPLYPYSGAPSIPGHVVNVPLPEGTGSEAYREAIEERWLPELNAFQPQMVLISAGFDAHREDPLAGLCLVDADYEWLTGQAMTIADRYAKGRIVSALEGGYSLPALSRCVPLHIRTLAAL